MKLVIQIPCLNEEETLPQVIADLPKQITGITQIERIVIDDGSTDNTANLAKELGVEHVVKLGRNWGLAYAFSKGLEKAVAINADIIVNTDGDNQYKGEDIVALVQPILNGNADLVIGHRDISNTPHFSRTKKKLQTIGSQFVSIMCGVKIPDAPSGFRAMTRDTALRINLFSKYTYTLEMLIQSGRSGMRIETVPIHTNPPTRPSRLMRSSLSYIVRSVTTVVRIFIVYRPFRFFAVLGFIPISIAMILSLRWVYLHHFDPGGGHVQSLILVTILSITGLLCWALGVVGDLLSINRRILQEMQYQQRRQLNSHSAPDDL